ncbi:MAG TPA: right-handed parallel beta-helix repeat-containing protein [Kouleothrix sp.]|uniref:right-handed parallel beta-helix repeat-containing protein n=1 Tax=Kouleothrix sp. TaxID=2779161 RepID=UPI002C2FBD48|nr:right-handed parallel beta-helix repeat-containing protein [Kouleothrix sp.]HRC74297.1 right-handed parallel beta-helix repeat-containing protein [Kouleothrix sp.]
MKHIVALISAVVLLVVAPTAIGASTTTTRYVGPMAAASQAYPGPGDCKGGTYPTIQAAVDAASPGDTIQVCPGEYWESVFVSQRVKLVAMKSGKAIIHGSIIVDGTSGGSGTRIQGFKIDAAASWWSLGIYVAGGSKIEIRDNTIKNAGADGIQIWAASDGSVHDNKVSASGYGSYCQSGGIVLWETTNYEVKKNDSSQNIGAGIVLHSTSNTKLRDNTTNKNSVDGIDVCSYNSATNTTGNLLQGNKASKNGEVGVYATRSAAGNTFKSNTLRQNALIDAQDETHGSGTAQTGNSWLSNTCGTSSPLGLCGAAASALGPASQLAPRGDQPHMPRAMPVPHR